MTCEPIEIICDQCGRLRAHAYTDVKPRTAKERRLLRRFILAMHREAQHRKETK